MLRRHDLLQCAPVPWAALLRHRPDLADVPLLADWARLGRPVIVRRRMAGDAADDVPAALPLPPSHGRQRIAIRFASAAGLTALPPVRLRDAAAAAPAAWRKLIAALVAVGDSVGITPCVFGALLWQHATGLSYLTSRSDLDLLWPVADEAAAASLVQALIRLEASAPVRLDGELLLPDGAGMQWREFAQAEAPAATVLVKAMHGVASRRRSELFRTRVPA